jgi:hypothetical protein
MGKWDVHHDGKAPYRAEGNLEWRRWWWLAVELIITVVFRHREGFKYQGSEFERGCVDQEMSSLC